MPGYTEVGRVRATPGGETPTSAIDEETGVADPGVMAVPGLIGALTPLRRSAVEDVLGGSDVPDGVAAELRRRRGGGQPLPENLSGPMGEHLGTDLSSVRVHADQGAGELAQSVDAAAFTHGNDIYFAPGAYQPGSPGGQRMLAHELSHVAQQRSGADTGGSGSLTVGKADDPIEAAADQSADRTMAALRRTPAAATAVHDHISPTDHDEAFGLEIRRWKWPWESKSKDKGSKGKGSKGKGSKGKGSKGKGSKGKGTDVKVSGTDVKVSGTATLPSTAPNITEDTKDTVPTAPPQPTVSEDTKDTAPESTSTPPNYPPPPIPTTVGEDTKDTTPSTTTSSSTSTVGEDTKDTGPSTQPTVGDTVPTAPPQPTVSEDTKDTTPSTTTPSTDTKVETGGTETTTTTTESKDTAPPVETPVVTYPRVFTIGKEQIQVNSAEEEVEADQIMSELKTTYGLDLSSVTTVKAIKKDYTDVPKKVTNKLKVSVWSMQELRALKEAATYYAPILGTERESSTLKGVVQGVTTVGKVKNAIDQDSKKGKLDDTTVGEYFSSSKNLGLFDAGTDYVDTDYTRDGQASDVQTSLSATAVHEMAHALVQPIELGNWINTLDFWTDRSTKSGKKGAEAPPSGYGNKNAAEDLCESVSMYFINRPQLKKLCPERDAFVDKVVKGWKPEEKKTAIDTAVSSPGSETPSETKD